MVYFEQILGQYNTKGLFYSIRNHKGGGGWVYLEEEYEIKSLGGGSFYRS